MSAHESNAQAVIGTLVESDIFTGRLVEAVKREWDGSGVDSAEPYLTNGAWRAVVAVLNEMARMAEEGGRR